MRRHYYDNRFYEEAEALGIATKFHHTNYISRDIKCPSGKDVYLTYERAEKALKMRQPKEFDKAIYKCHICGHYHFTTKDGKRRRPISYSRTQEKNNFNQTRHFLDSHQEVFHTIITKQRKKNKSYVISMYVEFTEI